MTDVTAEELDLVGPAEIARRLNLKPNTVAVYKARGMLPVPFVIVSEVPIWRWRDILAWNDDRERRPGTRPSGEYRPTPGAEPRPQRRRAQS